MKKYILFVYLVTAGCVSATEFMLTNHTAAPVDFNFTNEIVYVDIYVPAFGTSIVDLKFEPTYMYAGAIPLNLADAGDKPLYDWSDTVSIQLMNSADVMLQIIPGWNWFQVAEKCFWAFCAYYAAKLSLRALSSLWRMPEP